MPRLDDTIKAKKEKRQALEERNILIHPYNFDKKQMVTDCLKQIGKSVKTAGRIISLRPHGKVIFLHLQDSTGRIQVMIREQELGKEDFSLFKFIDTGDFLGVEGEVGETRTGEITISAEKLTFLGKALRPLPTSWNASEDKEVRFRKRYVDMLVNDDARKVLDARWLITKEIRRFLQDKYNFVEVETPILQALYGGTNAKPFSTHMNALDTDFYLRIAPELYLKRLIVGGYERIFEIARNFRNEGIDQTHQPEFTMIEWYHAYADYHTMMDTAEALIKHLTSQLYDNLVIKVGEEEIDMSGAWPRMTMVNSLQEFAQIDFDNLQDQEVQALLAKEDIQIIGEFTRGKAMFALFDKLVTPQLIKPIWIIDYPRDVSPLAKKHRLNPALAERFEGYIGGKEIADGWSEIVDPIDQRNIFENEQKRMRSGDDEAHPLDENFLEAMEYGMPPLGGIGMGIDRLVMFLTNTWSIREVIAFPTLRPKNQTKKMSDKETAQKAPVVETAKATKPVDNNKSLPTRQASEELLKKYIENDALRHHSYMVAEAMAAYAQALGEDVELWYQTGLLHDLDWEKYPDEHPNKAVNEILLDYPTALLEAIKAHAPGRTGKVASETLEKYLFACDELSGLMHAISLMRPNGFADMKYKSVKKKMKDKSFAANVSREDIQKGFDLIAKDPAEHVGFLIEVFKKMPATT